MSSSRVHPMVVYPPDPSDDSVPTEMQQEFNAMGFGDVVSLPMTVVLVNGRVAYIHQGKPDGTTTALSVDNVRAAAEKMVGDMKAGVAKHLPPGVTKGLDCSNPLLDHTPL